MFMAESDVAMTELAELSLKPKIGAAVLVGSSEMESTMNATLLVIVSLNVLDEYVTVVVWPENSAVKRWISSAVSDEAV
jgi:N-acetylmuramic acid 6-phosphate (MurNAc-6-P) etherase